MWAQPDVKGRRFVPFRMDIKGTKATWMGSLPHSWPNQVDALNGGRYDRWLDVKDSGQEDYADIPLTLGYYARQDIPFYYALADAVDYKLLKENGESAPDKTVPAAEAAATTMVVRLLMGFSETTMKP